jgi:hypothetical protein
MIQLKENIFVETITINQDKDKLYNLIVKDHKNHIYINEAHNFKLNNKYKDFNDELYNKFLFFCESLFGKIELLENNKKDCWAYVQNKNDFKTTIHDHLKTSIINGVYYLSVPNKNSGNIDFFDDELNIIYSHFPKENELLVFPAYLKHRPNQSKSDKYRIAINMEIICKV